MRFLSVFLVCGVGCGVARGHEPWWRCWLLPECPKCADDYCRKPLPATCPTKNCEPDCYCAKALPKTCAFKCKQCDDYCPKCLPRVLRCCPAWYKCGADCR